MDKWRGAVGEDGQLLRTHYSVMLVRSLMCSLNFRKTNTSILCKHNINLRPGDDLFAGVSVSETLLVPLNFGAVPGAG